MPTKHTLIVVAGATGNLGGRIARQLRDRGADVRALVRTESEAQTVAALERDGIAVSRVDYARQAELTRACEGASCVVSALSGLRPVIVDAQGALLDAAVAAGVPRFVPSDYCIDYQGLVPGGNRNLDLRREFRVRVDRAPIGATSILNGMFTDLLTGQAPIVLAKFGRVLYWENADQPMDFTTIDDTAAYTAAAALDPSTPRDLKIAGDVVSARGITAIASEVTGRPFKLTRGGGLGRLRFLTRVMRTLMPGGDSLYPPWQGMQYLHDMFGGRAKLAPLANGRYPGMEWTSVRDVLAPYLTAAAKRD